ncbi:DoxX family protein [Saccharopolyspora mangrovi]|uniref:DoxX family protein n=1 Tax=Saccharopolyspora mangrovi TaxID=3082379 RepID=A0ABU6AH28_9PSEU|nr:DoxX family protein [Saccharopolyspora sp. S2-29]MEB3370869.1 DoxX family protein [Saccharopolyspora sp. S2-29]
MVLAYVVVVVVTAVFNAVSAAVDLAGHRYVLATAEANGVPPGWLPVLGVLKGAGALGLVAGLAGVPVVGVLAAGGLVLFFLGAVVVHVRARTFSTLAAPGVFLGLAAGSLWLGLAV